MRVVRTVLTPSSTRTSSSSSAAFVGMPLSQASASRVLRRAQRRRRQRRLADAGRAAQHRRRARRAERELEVGDESIVLGAAEDGRVGRDAFAEQSLLETKMCVVHGPRLPSQSASQGRQSVPASARPIVIPRHNLCKTAGRLRRLSGGSPIITAMTAVAARTVREWRFGRFCDWVTRFCARWRRL